ncbi:MAG TPA: hypothetical protein VFE24_08170 [Pirellulales bacterium]|jgi:hypothetical protein|nr:hypothetical protein [Pirellulales bacterium]
MKSSFEISDEVLDRLVDGELPNDQRHSLLLQFEERPSEWRRCALAFLEAQVWRKAAAQAVETVARPPVRLPIRAGVAPAKGNVRAAFYGALPTYAAVAAAFLLAFGMGMWWPRSHSRTDQNAVAANSVAENPAAQNTVAAKPAREVVHAAPAVRESSPGAAEHLPGATEVANDAFTPASAPLPAAIRLTMAGQKENEVVELPVIQDAGQLNSILANTPPAVPAHIQQVLARTGHSIQQQRDYLPVVLEDGRQLVVPVDRVEVQALGTPSIQ